MCEVVRNNRPCVCSPWYPGHEELASQSTCYYVGCSDDGVCQLVIGPPLLETVDYCAVVYVEMQRLPHAPVWVGDHGDEDAQGLAGGRGVCY